ncbi:MAG: ATP-binding protein [Chitinophagaceae bacterium]|nr:ATP-binding protein [Chitinophagaceae bacterium]
MPIALWLFPARVCAQEEFSIDVLDVRKGLLSNFVTKTISDDKQFRYFATEAGISRYDGYRFRHYRPSPNSPGLVNENIETLLTAKEGHVWIGTKTGGLSRLDVKTQQLENWNDVFSSISSKPLRIVSLAEDLKGNVWVGSWNMGCFKVDPKQRKVVEHFPSTRPIYSLLSDTRGTVWYTDGTTLCTYKNEDGSLQRFTQPFNLYQLAEDTARKRVWMVGNIGANDVRLAYYDQMQGQVTEVPTRLQARFVSSLAIDQKMRVWLGSWGDGLYVSDPAVSSFHKVNTTGFNGPVRNTNHDAITNIYIDKHGIAWLCTAYGGVLVLYPNKGFRNLSHPQVAKAQDNNIISIGNGNNNSLLLGSISSGLSEVADLQQPAFRNMGNIPPVRINQIYARNGRQFLATNEGFYVFQQGWNSQPARYLRQEKVTAILLSGTNDLWVGTQQHGLKKMTLGAAPDTGQITSFGEFAPAPYQIENDRINKLVEDAGGRLWVATHAGINLWDPGKKQFRSHRELVGEKMPRIIIHDMLVSSNHMYLATPNGLYKFAITRGKQNSPVLELVKHYSEGEELVNQFVCALQEDRNGNIWFSTTTGIARLNGHTGLLHHFGKQDGVQTNAFYINSSYRDTQGLLYFGGDNGLLYFNPEAVSTQYEKPSIVMTGLFINNQPVEADAVASKNQILPQAIQYLDDIRLGYDNNDIAIQFAANDFLGTENIRYAYKLSPQDKEWISLRDKNEVSLTGLKPGKYRLAIRANRNNQGWGNPTEIELRIAYPPWLAWYAWVVYALLGAAILATIRRIRLRQQKLKEELQRVQFEKEKEHEINEAKINFFTNISHEFRTPLTLILSPCTELLADDHLTAANKHKISLVKSNAQKLLRLVNQLLDFRKSEHGLLTLRTHKEDIRKMVQLLVNDFAPAANAKKIELSFNAEPGDINADVDKAQLEMAINNLLSNAIKFTPAGGRVSVKLNAQPNALSLQVSDSGIGIAPEHLDRIFNRFYQVPGTNGQGGGSGIGLAFAKNIIELHHGSIGVQSTPGKGTSFTIQLPLQQAADKLREPDLADDGQEYEAADLAGTQPPQEGQSKSAKKQVVLVVDDNADIRQYLAGLLQEEYEVLEAEDGSVGHKIAVEAMPDLVISDVMMPQMNGIDLCAALKQNMATSHIPIILLTARASEAYELQGLQTGADDYIAKPFNPLIVQMRVRNMLENRAKLKAHYLKKVRFEPETSPGEKPDNLDDIFLNNAIELVNSNLQNENLGIEMMVDQLFMSQSTLFRKIKSLTGLSITGFIRALRIKKAAQLILETNMKMTDVAYEVGFNDYKYFKKSFQQQFGCLPSEYREKQSQNLQG